MGGKGSGRYCRGEKLPNSGYIHYTLWVRPSEWNKIQFDASATGKSVSKYIIDKVLDYVGTPVKWESDKTEKGSQKSVCFFIKDWERVLERVETSGLNISRYIVSILME